MNKNKPSQSALGVRHTSPVLIQFQVDCLEEVLKKKYKLGKNVLPISNPYKGLNLAPKSNFDLFRQEKNEVGAYFLSSRFKKK